MESTQSIAKKYDNFEPYICTTMNTINEYELNEFILWAEANLQPTKVSLLKIRQNPRDGEKLKLINNDNYLKCVETISELIAEGKMGDPTKEKTHLLEKAYYKIYDTIILSRKQFECMAGKAGGFIDYDGSVGVCEVLPYIGNLRDFDYDFKKIWLSNEANNIRSLVNYHHECQMCTHESEGLLPSLLFE